MGVLLLLGVDEAKWPWLPHRAAPAQQDGPSKERGCARGAEGGTGRRPHARPEAAAPTAKPAALKRSTETPHQSGVKARRQGKAGKRITRITETLSRTDPSAAE